MLLRNYHLLGLFVTVFKAQKMAQTLTSDVINLYLVQGRVNRFNNVLYSRGNISEDVIYFGGDVQDHQKAMQYFNSEYMEWSLENTSRLLAKRFPGRNIFVIRPNTMQSETHSVYSSFVTSDMFGNPTHTKDFGGIENLRLLIQNAKQKIDHVDLLDGQCSSEEGNCDDTNNTVLVGFSKGCLVLNQFLYEMAHPSNQQGHNKKFLDRVKEIHWLDGGHGGGSKTWITNIEVLKNLVGRNMQVYVHVTPYQVEDEARPWIKEEERLFVDSLKKLGVKVKETRHYDDEPRSIINHFKVLEVF